LPLEIKRLHLAQLTPPGSGEKWPVHGFAITHPDGAVLVDTGAGGPEKMLNDWRVVNVSVADALAEVGLSPADISLVINTHLHFDHCGQNAVFKHAPFYVQRAELERARRESPGTADWYDFMDARFELLDGDTEILPGLSVIATPGHTVGHQSVLVQTGDGSPELLIGDAAYKPRQLTGPLGQDLPSGQAADRPSWDASIQRVRSMPLSRVHFCHDTGLVHGDG
jgi:N-acyl homoserine lactone hydrolase